MVRHIAAIAVFALVPVHGWAQQCTTSDPNTVVDEIYRQILERPTNNDHDVWLDHLRNGTTVKEVVRQVAKSPEHQQVIGTGTSTVERQRAAGRVYDHLLGRRADSGEMRYRATYLQEKGLDSLVDDIVGSPEYNQNFGDWRVPGSNVRYCAGSTNSSARPRPTSGNRSTFERADRNRDGRITVSEWDDTRQTFLAADANRDSVLSRAEYNAAIATSGAVGTSGSRNEQFDDLDRNRNNRIERGEWRESTETFNWLDRNGDGWLSRGEVVGRRNNQ
jgi:hypothetical protein